MSISGITSNLQNTQTWQSPVRQRHQDFQSLASSLQSGDLSGAQRAYSDLQSMFPTATSTPNTVQTDFATLGQDLNAGNVTQAKKDFMQMNTDFQAALAQRSGSAALHHHGHHHQARASQESDSSSSADLSSMTSSLVSQYAPASAANPSAAANVLSLMG